MRILLFITTLNGGGAERIVQLLSGHLISQGHDVTVAALDQGSSAYTFPQEVHIVRVPSGIFNKGILKILLLPLQALELSKIVKQVKPDATISFLVRANLVNILSGCLAGGRKIFISHRNITQGLYGNASIKSRVMLLLIEKLYKRADCIITISEGVKKSLALLGIEGAKMTTIPNFINHRLIEHPASQIQPIPQDKPVLISIGRLVEQKDFSTLLIAFAIVRKTMDARLVIVGQGPLRQQLIELAASLQISDDVQFAGWLDNPFDALRQSSVFVLTSRYEGFGNVILEAMACGLPVICTDCPGGPNEILGNGLFGKLVEIGNSHEIAESILKILESPGLQKRMQQQSLSRANDFKVEHLAPRYLKLISACRYD